METYDTHRMLYDIYFDIPSLKLEAKINRRIVSLTPNYLYKCSIELVTLLSSDATNLSFSLITLFYNAFSVEWPEAIRIDGYILPNNSTFLSIFPQSFVL